MILTKNSNRAISILSLLKNKHLLEEVESLLIVVPTNRKLRELKKK